MGARIAITCGDPAGVGPEIALKALEEQPDLARDTVLIGPAGWLEFAQLAVSCDVFPVGPPDFRAEPGKPTEAGAEVALEALEAAALGAKEGRYDAVVTGPVSKAQLQQVGYPFPGQTEFFAERWSGAPVMAFAGGRLRVVLATWHLPLAQVPTALTPVALERACRSAAWLACALGAPEPRIGVCGLNPHAGEGGLLGTEECEFLDPHLDQLRSELPGLSRCLPGDTVFLRHLRDEFDAVVALYHDQGLGPVKTLEFDQAVNITLGLPHMRTSPDHGTAFDIAGTGQASATSMGNALRLAQKLSNSEAAADS